MKFQGIGHGFDKPFLYIEKVREVAFNEREVKVFLGNFFAVVKPIDGSHEASFVKFRLQTAIFRHVDGKTNKFVRDFGDFNVSEFVHQMDALKNSDHLGPPFYKR
jgi:hypothetical protein